MLNAFINHLLDNGVFIGYMAGFVTAGWLLPALGRWIDRTKTKEDRPL